MMEAVCERYYIALIPLSVLLLAPASLEALTPPNDACAQATAVSAVPYADTTATETATTDPDDPVPSCGNDSRGKSVWYSFTAPFGGSVAADTFDSNYDTVLSVYTGSCGTLTPVPGACNDDGSSAVVQSEVRFSVAEGSTYHLMVSAFNDDGGTLEFHLRSATSPGNDACTTATIINASPFATTLSTIDATTDSSDPLQSCAFGGTSRNANSVWYSFTAPDDGTVTVNTTSSDYDTVLTAYTGSCAMPSEIACNDDELFPDVTSSRVTFPVAAGMTYLLEATHHSLEPEGNMLQFALTFSGAGPTPTPTFANTPPATSTPTPPLEPCLGDCDGGGQVTVDEIVTGVNIALGGLDIDFCPLFDRDASRTVTVDELVEAIQHALSGC